MKVYQLYYHTNFNKQNHSQKLHLIYLLVNIFIVWFSLLYTICIMSYFFYSIYILFFVLLFILSVSILLLYTSISLLSSLLTYYNYCNLYGRYQNQKEPYCWLYGLCPQQRSQGLVRRTTYRLSYSWLRRLHSGSQIIEHICTHIRQDNRELLQRQLPERHIIPARHKIQINNKGYIRSSKFNKIVRVARG